ncbi:hypothetical protein BRAO375_3660057 [Bradyrhizobium sp. ORS 375]|uniref:hypothetical protein n=1 Tax=Bradyrhizobium sp. (strain ORS 375) TaxID=566679 RepID=UPI0002406999|nr:hypothetical protein [Bradyrhizobium sp. ORS 375]CCD94663.1 hypothetical protein BRAO375_3660057 [Bradyrhizobium sp. ORS 375]
MPEFILNVDDYRAFEKLDQFTRGYIEAMFFTETSPAYDSDEWHSEKCRKAQEDGCADGTIPGDTGFDDLSADALADIISDCAAFQRDNEALLEAAYESGHYDADRAGNDYWYTRNGHGCGFWDRGLGDIGDKLSDACRYSSVDLFYTEAGKVCIA